MPDVRGFVFFCLMKTMWYDEKSRDPGFLILNLPFTECVTLKRTVIRPFFTSCGKAKLDVGMKVLYKP